MNMMKYYFDALPRPLVMEEKRYDIKVTLPFCLSILSGSFWNGIHLDEMNQLKYYTG